MSDIGDDSGLPDADALPPIVVPTSETKAFKLVARYAHPTVPSNHLQINVSYDPSAAAAPAGFQQAVQQAVSYFETFNDPISITIDFGFGEVDGYTIKSPAVGESLTHWDTAYSFSDLQTIAARLNAENSGSRLNSLPAQDPTGGGLISLSTSQEKALGLIAPNETFGTTPDGWIGLNSATNWDFQGGTTPASGQTDAVGVLEHEISEAMGRVGYSGALFNGVPMFTIMDLLRTTPGGSPDPEYLSGTNDLTAQSTLLLNNPNAATNSNGPDRADWAPSVQGDSFGTAYTGIALPVSQSDLRVMASLGFAPPPAPASIDIAGTQGGQVVAYNGVLSPFSGTTITDSTALPSDAAVITLSNPAAGTLALPGGSLASLGNGEYRLASVGPATLQSELRGLVFTATGPGDSTAMTLTVSDTAGLSSADSVTTVSVGEPPPPANAVITGTDNTTGEPVFSLTNNLDLSGGADSYSVTSKVPGSIIALGEGNNIVTTTGDGNAVLTGGMLSQILNDPSSTGNVLFLSTENQPIAWDAIANFNAGDAIAIIGAGPQSVFWNQVTNGVGNWNGLTFEDFTGNRVAFVSMPGVTKSQVVTAFGTDPADNQPYALIVHA